MMMIMTKMMMMRMKSIVTNVLRKMLVTGVESRKVDKNMIMSMDTRRMRVEMREVMRMMVVVVCPVIRGGICMM